MRAIVIALLTLAATTAHAHASDLAGLWRTQTEGGLVELAACGDALCGTIVSSPRLDANPNQRDVRNKDPAMRTRALRGLRIVEARPAGERLRGWVYNPEDGETYSGEITRLADGRLRLRGCVVWPLCSSQVWTRVR